MDKERWAAREAAVVVGGLRRDVVHQMPGGRLRSITSQSPAASLISWLAPIDTPVFVSETEMCS